MYKETRTYNDYNGRSRTEDFYFNLTKAEVFELEISYEDGVSEWLETLVKTKNVVELADTFKTILLKAYGRKSADGRMFEKIDKDGHKLANDFAQTEAFSDMYMELAFDSEKASKFFNGIFPTFTEEELKRMEKKAEEARAKLNEANSEVPTE